MKHETYQLDSHGPIYAYLPATIEDGEKLPLILDLNCTTGNPRAEVKTNGWESVAEKNKLIVVAPTYDDYATYSETGYLKRVIDDAVDRYPVDTHRIYSVGFSNGGASSGALASTYPHLLAGIAAIGWMIGLENTNLTIPFMLIQGTDEYTTTVDGAPSVMDDERVALRDLMTANRLATGRPDYQKTPYWGYQPDRQRVVVPNYHDYDPYGHFPRHRTDRHWQVSEFYRRDFKYPLAELVLVEGSRHIPHDCNARFAWDFLRHFQRDDGGQIEER